MSSLWSQICFISNFQLLNIKVFDSTNAIVGVTLCVVPVVFSRSEAKFFKGN